jgi:hypothetical protein
MALQELLSSAEELRLKAEELRLSAEELQSSAQELLPLWHLVFGIHDAACAHVTACSALPWCLMSGDILLVQTCLHGQKNRTFDQVHLEKHPTSTCCIVIIVYLAVNIMHKGLCPTQKSSAFCETFVTTQTRNYLSAHERIHEGKW